MYKRQGVLDFDVKNGKVADYRYKLLPVFANMLPADKDMDCLLYTSPSPRDRTRSRMPSSA